MLNFISIWKNLLSRYPFDNFLLIEDYFSENDFHEKILLQIFTSFARFCKRLENCLILKILELRKTVNEGIRDFNFANFNSMLKVF